MTYEERVANTLAIFENAIRGAGCWISGDGRVGEKDAAALIGWSVDHLRSERQAGRGPPSYRIGGGGHRVSYRLSDLAQWVEDQKN